MTEIPTEDGQVTGLPDTIYHADRRSLSSSGASILLKPGGPARFREHMDNPPKPKRQYDFGHAAHKFVLGEGEEIVPVDAADWRTKDAKEQRDQAHAEGKIPLLRSEVDVAMRIADRVAMHPVAWGLFSEGQAEVSMYVTDPETGVRLRARPDWMQAGDRLTIVDFKTAVDGGAHRDVFERKAFEYSYHLQMSWYITVAQLLGHESPAFLFVVAEKSPPYLVNVIELDADYFALGRDAMREAIRIYRDCTEAGEWPGYAPIIHSASPPAWAKTSQSINDLSEDIA
ncbi:PD-(D/E)XK nuclease-like domain-containing protein [Mycobacterium sp. pUA109]|uniref:PD-(D/E)XK nuclease-like domain-containing protein n=1 Tax=Mycobacterium sp. pUA109 TaxID=3238982 RepID=UPI00351BE3DA